MDTRFIIFINEVYLGYGIFQAALIHIYNCTNNSPEIAKMSKEYVQISIDECLKPITSDDEGITPQHILPLIKTLMHLSGADKENNMNSTDQPNDSTTSNTAPVNTENYDNNVIVNNNNNVHTTNTYTTAFNMPLTQPHPQAPAPLQTASPMSVHSILSPDWNKNNNQATAAAPTTSQENASAVPWQNLFSSAATPFFDADIDIQSKFRTSFFIKCALTN